MLKITLTQLKPHSLPKLKKWGRLLMGRYKKDAELSLREENIARESAFMVTIDGKPYIVHFQDLVGTRKPANLKRQVNRKHREINRQTFEPNTQVTGRLIYDLKSK